MRRTAGTGLRILAVVGLIAAAGCGLPHATSTSGHVHDAATGEPLEDTFVLVYWTGEEGWIYPDTTCLYMVVTRTDDDGHFYVPAQIRRIAFLWNSGIRRHVLFYKPGYDGTRGVIDVGGGEGDWHLGKVKQLFEERIMTLDRLYGACRGGMAGETKAYFQARRREALSLARTEAQERRAWDLELDWWLWSSREYAATPGFRERQDLKMRRRALEAERGTAGFDRDDYLRPKEKTPVPTGAGAVPKDIKATVGSDMADGGSGHSGVTLKMPSESDTPDGATRDPGLILKKPPEPRILED